MCASGPSKLFSCGRSATYIASVVAATAGRSGPGGSSERVVDATRSNWLLGALLSALNSVIWRRLMMDNFLAALPGAWSGRGRAESIRRRVSGTKGGHATVSIYRRPLRPIPGWAALPSRAVNSAKNRRILRRYDTGSCPGRVRRYGHTRLRVDRVIIIMVLFDIAAAAGLIQWIVYSKQQTVERT